MPAATVSAIMRRLYCSPGLQDVYFFQRCVSAPHRSIVTREAVSPRIETLCRLRCDLVLREVVVDEAQ